MPKYLIQGSYTQEGVKGLLKEGGSSRKALADKLVKKLKGSVESYHFCLGSSDFVLICTLPDHKSALALSMAVKAGGGAGVSITELIDPKDIDAAVKIKVGYKPPGKK